MSIKLTFASLKKKWKCNLIWNNDECIDVVDSFVNSGVQFYYTGSMKNVVSFK